MEYLRHILRGISWLDGQSEYCRPSCSNQCLGENDSDKADPLALATNRARAEGLCLTLFFGRKSSECHALA